MKYIVINMTTKEEIICNTRVEGRDIAERLSIETKYLWFLMIITE